MTNFVWEIITARSFKILHWLIFSKSYIWSNFLKSKLFLKINYL